MNGEANLNQTNENCYEIYSPTGTQNDVESNLKHSPKECFKNVFTVNKQRKSDYMTIARQSGGETRFR